MTPTLTIKQLVKNYDSFSMGPIDLSIAPGCAVGLVGDNGAGKTTLFRCLMGTVQRDQGVVIVNEEPADHESGQWRNQVGYVGDFHPFFDAWTGARNLAVLQRFYAHWDQQLAQDLAASLSLDLNLKVKSYSTGQRTKLALVSALAHRPSLLLLDEPANGLDPVAREAFLDTLFSFVATGETALLYATHHTEEIEGLADRLVFMHRGQVIRDAIKEDLLESWRNLSFRCEHSLVDIPHALVIHSEPPYQQVISDDADATVAYLRRQGINNIEQIPMTAGQIAVRILRQAMGPGIGEHHV
jgi:ABC-2 type transport system ATP-binding protein